MTDTKNQRSWIEIDLSAFASNLQALKSYLQPQQHFLQVVKADAYGHGAYQVARVAIDCGAVMLGVANVEEAVQLRFQKITAPILILSPSLESEVDLIVDNDIIASVSELSFCESLNKAALAQGKTVPVHLKIDTGMNRNGVRADKLRDFLKAFTSYENLEIQGLFSHFAASDDDEKFTLEQLNLFQDCFEIFHLDEFSKINKSLKWIHIANSAGALKMRNAPPLPPPASAGGAEITLVRFGIISYGYSPNPSFRIPHSAFLTPVMSFKSRISHISTAKAGETIGYNRTYKAEKDIKYATIPVGYADGYDFLLSNKASVVINDTACPVLGKVSMDMLCVNITSIPEAKLNDEVLLMGAGNERYLGVGVRCSDDNHQDQSSSTKTLTDSKDTINNVPTNKQEDSADSPRKPNTEHRTPTAASVLSSLYNGSVYELLCQLGRRAKRYYYYDGKIVDDEPLTRRAFIPKDFETSKLNNIIQQAIAHRMQSDELSSVIYQDILKYFFADTDRDIAYRSNFKYDIEFEGVGCEKNSTQLSTLNTHNYYKVKTIIAFDKILQNETFTVVCANDNAKLQYFFKQKNCEYRWLLDKNLALTLEMFRIIKATITPKTAPDYYELLTMNYELSNDCLVYSFNDPVLKKLVNTEVHFQIEIETYYPVQSHQLAVYLNEITKGVEVRFTYPTTLFEVDTTAIFSGRERFPQIDLRPQTADSRTITVKTQKDTWVFPTSGIVFSFRQCLDHPLPPQ